EILPSLIERIIPVAKSLNIPFEVILVNDGSSDDSWSTIRRLTAMHACIRGISMMRNYGQHNALLAGLRVATYAKTVTLGDVLLTWGTVNFGFVRVKHDERRIGRSTYTVWKLIRHALNMITGFSVLPLQVASIIGFALSFGGLAVLAYVLLRFMFYGSTVAG